MIQIINLLKDDEEYNLDEVCRTCTASYHNGVVFVPIFQESSDLKLEENIQIPEELNETLKLMVKQNDGLPQQICEYCFEQLKNIEKFRRESNKSQEKLTNYFKRLTTENSNFEHIIVPSELSFDINVKPEKVENEGQTENISDFEDESVIIQEFLNVSDIIEYDEGNDEEGTEDNKSFSMIEKCRKCKKYCHATKIDSHTTRSCMKMLNRSSKKTVLNSELCCCYCDEIFDIKKDLEDHLINFHPANEPYTCTICSKNFKSHAKLQIHSETHSKTITMFKCNICQETFDNRSKYLNHRNTAHPDGTYECKFCTKKFVSSKKFHNHLKYHDDSLKKYACDECGKSFLRLHRLKEHKRSHTDERPYVCDKCGYSLKSSGALKFHIKNHEKVNIPTPNRTQILDAVGKQVNYEWKPKIKTAETTQEEVKKYSFTCPVCSQMFMVPTALEKHMNLHDANRKYRCKECDCSYNSSAHLRRHINRAHTTDKPHVCKFCSRGFRDPGTKADHERLHFEQKRKCRFCEKSICEKYIKVHERTHTGEKPCVCLICGKSFTYTLALARHHNKFHTLEDSNKLSEEVLSRVQNRTQ